MSDKYQFSPRPEAHAMNWGDLLPPVRDAVRDLLIRIDGAVSSSAEKDFDGKIVSNSFLVYGARGTGKTTVLHSAKKAACDAEKDNNFFSETEPDSLEGSAKTSVENLNKKDIIWLDILDLEPLPKKANLLTILLTRVLNALDQPNRKKSVPRSIFEEDSDSARHQLQQLINDATLLWEDVHEADTRNIANRQIEAADIYSNCCKNFKKAMDTLSEELSHLHGHDNRCSIILPIDNIDRSTDHLQSLVKLAQMVSHPSLWLVMAGDRIEVEAFLERAYWKELIHSDDNAGAQGKMGAGGEDEALIMARLQSTAVAQKIWPPNHRLEVDLVRPLETLKFSLSKSKRTNIYELLKKVNIPTTSDQRKEKKDDQSTIKLIDLFDIQDKAEALLYIDNIQDFSSLIKKLKPGSQNNISQFIYDKLQEGTQYLINHTSGSIKLRSALIDDLNKIIKDKYFYNEERYKGVKLSTEIKAKTKQRLEGEKLTRLNKQLLQAAYPDEITLTTLTRVAQQGLRLPARAVLDLWQLANWVVNDSARFDQSDFRAEKIARTMLRNVIAASRVSSKVGQLLQNENIRRTDNGGTQLNFLDFDLSLRILYKEYFYLSFRDHLKDENSRFALHSWLSFENEEDLVLMLNTRIYSDSKNDQLKNKKDKKKELSHPVAAWLMILYDILILAEFEAESVVLLSHSPLFKPPPMVSASHEAINYHLALNDFKRPEPTELGWPTPIWNTFLAHDVFSQRWMKLCSKIQTKQMEENIDKEILPIFLVANWISYILETFVLLNSDCDDKIKNWGKINNQATKYDIQEEQSLILNRLEGMNEPKIKNLYINTIKSAVYMYSVLKENSQAKDTIEYKEQASLELWLEEGLPLLLSHLYVPLDNDFLALNYNEIREWIQAIKNKEYRQKNLGRFYYCSVGRGACVPITLEMMSILSLCSSYGCRNYFVHVPQKKSEDTNLIDYWVKNSCFIQADIANALPNIFSDNGDTKKATNSKNFHFTKKQFLWALGDGLYQLLNPESEKTEN